MNRKFDNPNLSELAVAEKKPHGLKGKKPNNPNLGYGGLMVKPGDNAKYLGVTIQIGNLPKVNLHDVGAVRERLDEYFRIHAANDMKPTVAGMAIALGIDRRRLWEIKSGSPSNDSFVKNMPSDCADVIKRAYNIMENLWENYMQNGKINPVSGIFLGKNNYGYQDKVEHVVTPNLNSDEYNVDDIRKRYLNEAADFEVPVNSDDGEGD